MPAAGGNAERAVQRQEQRRGLPNTGRQQGRQLQDRTGLRLNTATALAQRAHGRGGDIRSASASEQWHSATGGGGSWSDWASNQQGNRNSPDAPNWWQRSGQVSAPTNVTVAGTNPGDRLDTREQWEAFDNSGPTLDMSTDWYRHQQNRWGASGGAGEYNHFKDLF